MHRCRRVNAAHRIQFVCAAAFCWQCKCVGLNIYKIAVKQLANVYMYFCILYGL